MTIIMAHKYEINKPKLARGIDNIYKRAALMVIIPYPGYEVKLAGGKPPNKWRRLCWLVAEGHQSIKVCHTKSCHLPNMQLSQAHA